jgi:hypothetical protein
MHIQRNRYFWVSFYNCLSSKFARFEKFLILRTLNINLNLFVMKKILLFLVCVIAFCIASISQIVLSTSTYPKPGDQFYLTNDTSKSSSISYQAASANGPWNFSSSLSAGKGYTMKFHNVSDYPTALTVAPTTTLAFEDFQNISLVNTSNGIQVVGMIADGKMYSQSSSFKVTDPAIIIPANAKLNSEFTDILKVEMDAQVTDPAMSVQIDSIRIKSRTKISAKFDAEGSLTIPSGTYTALRMKKVESDSSAGSMHSPMLKSWIALNYQGEDTSITYEWFILKDNVLVSALKLEYDNAKHLTDKYWLTNIPTGINTYAMNNDILVYPTFTNGVVHIRSSVNILKAYVFDISGKNVYTNTVSNGVINISNLKSGFYTLQIFDSNNRAMKCEKIIKR